MTDTPVVKTLESILAEKRAKVNDATLENLANKQIKVDAQKKALNASLAKMEKASTKITETAAGLNTMDSNDISLALTDIDNLFY